MPNLTPLAKAPTPPARNAAQKVVKLAKARAAKNALAAKSNSARGKKKEAPLRPAAMAQANSKTKSAAKPSGRSEDKARRIAAIPLQAPAKKPLAKNLDKPMKPVLSSVARKKPGPKEKPGNVAAAPHARQAPPEETGLRNRLESTPGRQHPLQPKEAARLTPADIKIYQIYYLPEHKSSLDPDFTAFDNSGNTSRLFEFSVFTKLAQSSDIRQAKLWGAMSWKFGKKAGISGRMLKEEIIANPGYDAYYCNPYPENEALYHNMWLQGELAHPNFMPLCTEIFEVAGLPTSLLTSVQPSSEFAAANYFVANQAFWKAYIGFISRLLISADKKLSPTAKRILYSSTADKFGAHADASYIPFLVERLFTVFLLVEGDKFRTRKLSLPSREKKDNVHLKLLAEMKDVACRTKFVWLAACWINYRNLYLSKTYGDGWTKTHLKQITPASITFMPENIKPTNQI